MSCYVYDILLSVSQFISSADEKGFGFIQILGAYNVNRVQRALIFLVDYDSL